MITELMGNEDYLRILLILRKKGELRFGQIESLLGLNPARVDRALKFLRKGSWIRTRILPAEKGLGRTEYSLGKRGAAFLEAFTAFTAEIHRRRSELGLAEAAELQVFCQQADQPGEKSNIGRIARVIKIGPLHHDEKETMTKYRGGCLKLSPAERIAEMRALSRRVILMNPKNPRSPHIERGIIKITQEEIGAGPRKAGPPRKKRSGKGKR